HFANLQHVLVAELGHPTRWVDVHLFHDFLGLLRPDAMDILQGDPNALVCGYVNTSDTGHSLFTPAANRTRRLRLNGCKSFINAHTTPSPSRGARHRCSIFRVLGAAYLRIPPRLVNLHRRISQWF